MAKRARVRTAPKRAAGGKVKDQTGYDFMAKEVSAPEKVKAKPYDQRPHNDELEGVIRDPVMYKGRPVSLIKDIGVHDPEYDPNVRQVKIQALGEKPEVIPSEELNETFAPPVEEVRRPKRVPSLTFPKGHPGAFPGEGR